MSNRKLIVGNWKMNPSILEEAKRLSRGSRALAAKLEHTDVVICPPLAFIQACSSKRAPSNLKTGAQAVSFEESGSHTGEVGAAMLSSIGVKYVITGHSETRAAGDTDESVSKRLKTIVEGGMTGILCVGEKVRDDGGAYLETLKVQIQKSLSGIEAKHAKNIIMAYEPVWAIGAAEAMDPSQIYEMSLFVKKTFADVFGPESAMKVTVLYGGSANFRNAADIISIGKVDGLLVGRESINMPGFKEMLKAVDAL